MAAPMATITRSTRRPAVRSSMPPMSLLLLAVVLANLSWAPVRVEGTFFIIGGACLAGLETVSAAAGELIAVRALEQPIEQVEEVCRLLMRFSLPGIAVNDVLPLVRELVQFTGEASLDIANPDNFDNFERIIRQIANQASLSLGKR